MLGYIEMDNLPSFQVEYQKPIQDLKSCSGHREEINGYYVLTVIVQKTTPCLRGRVSVLDHVLRNSCLRDVNAKHFQFTVNPWRTPTHVLL